MSAQTDGKAGSCHVGGMRVAILTSWQLPCKNKQELPCSKKKKSMGEQQLQCGTDGSSPCGKLNSCIEKQKYSTMAMKEQG